MSKILTLNLFYKDKLLDTAKQERDFKKKFKIGKNKNFLWQILDKKFPEKFTILKKEGNKYILNLMRGMNLNIEHKEQKLSLDEAKRKNLLKKNRVYITPNTQAEVEFLEDWKIQLKHVEVAPKRETKQIKALKKQYGRRPSPSQEQRFTRNFLILGLIFTVIGTIVFDITYKEKEIERSIRRLTMPSQTKVSVPDDTTVPTTVADQPPEYEPSETEQEQQVETPVQQAQQADEQEGQVNLQNQFGFNPDEAAEQESEVADFYKANVVSAVTASGSGTGSGTGQGSGQGAGTGEAGTGSEPTGGGTSGFNVEGVDLDSDVDYSSAGQIKESDIGTGGEVNQGSGLIEVSEEDVQEAKSLDNIKVSTINTEEEFVSQLSAGYQNLPVVDIEEEEGLEQEVQTPDQNVILNIKSQIDNYKGRIRREYQVASINQELYGKLTIKIAISSNGNVENVGIITSTNSEFSKSFLNKVENIVKEWTFRVNSQKVISFSITFFG